MKNSSNKFAKIILVALGVLVFAGFGIGSQIERKPNIDETGDDKVLTTLTAEDVAMIFEEAGNPSMLAQVAEDIEKRKALLENLKQLLLLANEAAAVGLADDTEVIGEIEISEMQALATAYGKKIKAEAGKPDDTKMPFEYLSEAISETDKTVFWQNPDNEARFEKILQTVGKRSGQAITDEVRKTGREQWALGTIAAERARAAGLDKERKIHLNIEIGKAQILAREYAARFAQNFEPNADEIAAYIAANPEADPQRLRDKAESILQRVRAGEGFKKLAREFSQDEPSRVNGGLYKNVKKGQFVPEFEQAALALEKGQISDLVQTKYGFHIIKLVGRKDETYSVRHIQIGTMELDDKFGAPKFVPTLEKAKEAAQKIKTAAFFARLEQRHTIILPTAAELKLKVPTQPETLPIPPSVRGSGEPQIKNEPVSNHLE